MGLRRTFGRGFLLHSRAGSPWALHAGVSGKLPLSAARVVQLCKVVVFSNWVASRMARRAWLRGQWSDGALRRVAVEWLSLSAGVCRKLPLRAARGRRTQAPPQQVSTEMASKRVGNT